MRRMLILATVLAMLTTILAGCGLGEPAPRRGERELSAPGMAGLDSTPTSAPTRTIAVATVLAGRASAEAVRPTLPAVATVTATRPVATATPARSATADPNVLPVPALYPVPMTCAVAPWSALERRRTYPAFWLDGDGLAAGAGPHLFEGGQKIQWQAEPGGKNTLILAGARLDGPSPAPPQIVSQYNIGVGTWASTTAFPAPGCWRIEATDGVHTLAAIVYVYPRACTPPAIRQPGEAVPATCAPPAP